MKLDGLPESLARYQAALATRRARPADAPVAATETMRSTALEGEAGEARPTALAGATLWELLTTEERAYFSDPATLGALTYRAGGRGTDVLAPTGQRVDVRA
jgi:hypothetical protein